MPSTPLAVFLCLVFLRYPYLSLQPLRPIHTLAKRGTSLSVGATVVIVLVALAIAVFTLVCCCAMINRQPKPPEPTLLELVDEVSMLCMRIDELQARHVILGPVDGVPAVQPPTYTP
ncbi:hypothetical protein B0H17DRAFT_1144037 [Mycena rosella]|uniref:Uncharacterized protein n=1 Tax=Mycena rosella TaxID=1033263 RepID=A0AAD7CU00_MYCRO|nr:hypothetical protein B0H17DRAFT_1144037 [Mycena rosella]